MSLASTRTTNIVPFRCHDHLSSSRYRAAPLAGWPAETQDTGSWKAWCKSTLYPPSESTLQVTVSPTGKTKTRRRARARDRMPGWPLLLRCPGSLEILGSFWGYELSRLCTLSSLSPLPPPGPTICQDVCCFSHEPQLLSPCDVKTQ